jgi:hypothetical protein
VTTNSRGWRSMHNGLSSVHLVLAEWSVFALTSLRFSELPKGNPVEAFHIGAHVSFTQHCSERGG